MLGRSFKVTWNSKHEGTEGKQEEKKTANNRQQQEVALLFHYSGMIACMWAGALLWCHDADLSGIMGRRTRSIMHKADLHQECVVALYLVWCGELNCLPIFPTEKKRPGQNGAVRTESVQRGKPKHVSNKQKQKQTHENERVHLGRNTLHWCYRMRNPEPWTKRVRYSS